MENKAETIIMGYLQLVHTIVTSISGVGFRILCSTSPVHRCCAHPTLDSSQLPQPFTRAQHESVQVPRQVVCLLAFQRFLEASFPTMETEGGRLTEDGFSESGIHLSTTIQSFLRGSRLLLYQNDLGASFRGLMSGFC